MAFSACPIKGLAAVLAAVLTLSPAHAAGEVRVRFMDPEQYTDARLHTCHQPDELVLDTVERHLRQMAAPCLDAGDMLDIEVRDIDLAGQHEWWRQAGPCGPRLMREVTWPRIRLAYVLRRSNGEVSQASEMLSDMNYLWRSGMLSGESTPLPYERAMLTDWVEKRFCK